MLEDASADHYHWRCREPFCKGARLIARSEQLTGDAIARDMADKRSRVGIFATSDERRKEQAAFRRVASTLRADHPLYRYLSEKEREAMATAAGALRRLARATETAKDIMTRRESHERKEREQRKRVENEQAFQTIIAQEFDPDTVLLRCEAMADLFDMRDLYGADIRSEVNYFRRKPDKASWSQLVQRIGGRLTGDMFAGGWTLDFEGYWRQWKAKRRVRDAISQAQNKGMREGDPDA
ncbi:hypothetical protein T31B1_18812 [Salinisphaera sp. T31B1]